MTALRPTSAPLLKQAVRTPAASRSSYFRQDIEVKRKIDGTEVSEAGLAVDAALKRALGGCRPSYGWLSEESEDKWDLAGVLLVEEAGGTGTDHHGQTFRFNRQIPRFPSLVAAPRAFTPS